MPGGQRLRRVRVAPPDYDLQLGVERRIVEEAFARIAKIEHLEIARAYRRQESSVTGTRSRYR